MSNKLESYRSEIVSLNHQILDLLSKRGELAPVPYTTLTVPTNQEV
ncbi:hypothetical protein G6Y30_02375 [Staphylococcus aureus]|nr:hypothetical protein [Staphylococcus aureus]